ncbi:MAG: hypothetical protein ABWZ52_13815 [Acidimicrobiales bacterium]
MTTVLLSSFAAVPGKMPQQLLDYWVHGEGAAKIRWGTPGDFDRCVRNLRKYFRRDPEGLCNRLHTRALGVPPGQEHGLVADAVDFDERLYDHEAGLFPTKKMWRGRLAPIGVPTGDRRRFERGGIGHRDLPLPLLYQLVTGEGHAQSVVVGRILGVTITDDEAYGYGDWLDTEHTPAAQERMANGIGGVSVDLDDLEYELRVPGTSTVWKAEEQCSEESGECAVQEFVVTKGRIAAATLVAIPAFTEARLEMYDGVDEEGVLAAFDEMPAAYEEGDSCGCGVSAAAIAEQVTPVNAVAAAVATAFTPPAAAFSDPGFSGVTGLVLDDERVPGYTAIYGHLGTWEVGHVGLPGQRLPRSPSGYAYFHVGEVYTAEGDSLPVGKIVWGGKHPSMQVGMRAAAQHYDDTSRAVAVVRAGEDAYGVWVSGVLLPWVTDEVKLDLGISPLSGDWRPVGGRLELIAALTVNTPGFPVVRARQEAGRVTALIASAGPAVRLQDEEASVVRWDAEANAATITTGGPGRTVTINLSPDVLQPYVEEQLRQRRRREAVAAVHAQFASEIERANRRVAELYSVFTNQG